MLGSFCKKILRAEDSFSHSGDVRQKQINKRIQFSAVITFLPLTMASVEAVIIGFSQYRLAYQSNSIALSR
jgi:hypothetical protein